MYLQGDFGFKYAVDPRKEPYIMNYQRNEREDFLEKWEYVLKYDDRFDEPKVYFTNFETMEILDITDKLEELKNRI
jgi:hypothetical protein